MNTNTVKISMDDLKAMVLESIKGLRTVILENKCEEKRRVVAHEQTRKVFAEFYKDDLELDDVYYGEENPNRLSKLDFFVNAFENDFFHAPRPSKPIIRLEPMVARFALTIDNVSKQRLRKILYYIEKMSKEGKIKVTEIPLDMSWEKFNSVFGGGLDMEAASKNRGIGKVRSGSGRNTEYEIIPDLTFSKAKSIGKYSYGNGKLCYIKDKSVWDYYTANGVNRVFAIVKKNFMDYKDVHNGVNEFDFLPESAYDEYGLSMIFVFVNPNGKISTSNVRWNHSADFGNGMGVDYALDEDDISAILGVDFYSVFKPYSIYSDLNKAVELQKGRLYTLDASDGFSIVYLDYGKRKFCNIVDENMNVLSPNLWFDYCQEFHDGCAVVHLNRMQNYIREDGKLILDKWADKCEDFKDGFGYVEYREGYGEKCYMVDTNGTMAPTQNHFII